MPWCPNCKLEYVEGIKICPDCKTALVATLEEAEEIGNLEDELNEISYESVDEEGQIDPDTEFGGSDVEEGLYADDAMAAIKSALLAKGIPEEEIAGIIENARRRAMNNIPKYRPYKERYSENKSASGVLIVFGLIGLIILLLNTIGVITLPIAGSSKWLVTGVLAALFLIFVASGIKAFLSYKKLKPMIAREEENTEKALEFLKKAKEEKRFEIDDPDISMEEKSLIVSNMAVAALEEEFDDLEPGFSYYVTDSFYSELFDEEPETETENED
ncbi:MAG: hypothetical protein J6U67_00895 [Lachnospiraceae bacterium]|nr:hypothetical protein [Lachnospiraceae bacterium]